MSEKKLPFNKEQIEKIIQDHPTPFHIYDEAAIRENARRLLKAFEWAPGFKEYFAVKACPNPHLMKILHEEGFGSDCSSLPELVLSEKVGIVGRTGSGKSTILKLLLRFYDPSAGSVRIDGVDLRDRNLCAVRSITGYAPQDAFLFSRSIEENIAYGRPETTSAQVFAAARSARLAEEIESFPDSCSF